jgi:hypothetical protein
MVRKAALREFACVRREQAGEIRSRATRRGQTRRFNPVEPQFFECLSQRARKAGEPRDGPKVREIAARQRIVSNASGQRLANESPHRHETPPIQLGCGQIHYQFAGRVAAHIAQSVATSRKCDLVSRLADGSEDQDGISEIVLLADEIDPTTLEFPIGRQKPPPRSV